jgi:cardiolipin synthase
MTQFIAGNHLQLLRNGAEFFPALETAIHNATHEIYLQTYIFEADATGVRIGNALKKAAQRGVVVHVLLDGFGSKDLAKSFIKSLEDAGVQVMLYRPKISPWSLKKSRLRRLHRKVTVIDGKIGFVGGINIIDDFNIPEVAHTNPPPRVDYALRVQGALLPAMLSSVRKLWRRMAWLHGEHVESASNTLYIAQLAKEKGVLAAFVLRDNLLHRRDIENAYLTAITKAKSEIIIANAYFVPGRKFRQALLKAAKRGVNVKLLLQGRMEYFLMFATHAFYSLFLKNGIEIYEYHQSFMHSKVAVIDQEWATVGSSNIDPFSLMLAREANIVFKDKPLATALRTDILNTIAVGARKIEPVAWAQGNLFKRFVSWLVFGLVRLFLGVIGLSHK